MNKLFFFNLACLKIVYFLKINNINQGNEKNNTKSPTFVVKLQRVLLFLSIIFKIKKDKKIDMISNNNKVII